MREKILGKIYNLSLRRGKTLLLVMLVITILLSIPIPFLKISTSHMDLIPSDHPEQARYLKFMKEFGAADSLIVVLEGDKARLKKAAPLFARELGVEQKWVKSVFYKTDTAMIINSFPLYIPLEHLKTGLTFLNKHQGSIQKFKKINDLVAMINEMKGGASSPVFIQNPEAAPQLLTAMNALLEEWIEWLKNPEHKDVRIAEHAFVPGSQPDYLLNSDGLLFSRDYTMLILMVQPMSPNDDMSYLRPFMKSMRAACERVYKDHPEFKGTVKFAFTGLPAHTFTETQTIQEDVGHAGLLAVFIVGLIMIVGFRSIRKTILGIIPILSGLFITLGLIVLTVGRLNLISSAMLAVLYGIGIDFSIYLIQRTEEELGNGHTIEEAVYLSTVATSKSIVTGGLTAALSFFAIGFSKFQGYKELGWTAGIGILVMMFTTFLILPALILIFKVEPRFYDLKKTMNAAQGPKRRKALMAAIIIGALATVLSGIAATQLKMDYNALKLLPRDTESTTYQLKMEEKSDFKLSFAAVTSKDLAELQRLTARIRTLPTVSTIQSLSEVIPDNQDEKIKLMTEFRRQIGPIKQPARFGNRSAAEYVQALKDLQNIFEEAQDKAFSGGRSDMVNHIEKIVANIGTLNENLTGPNRDAALTRTRAFERELYHEIGKGLVHVERWLNPKPVTEAGLSPEFISRFKSPQGTYVAMVFPKGSIWEVKFLDQFVNQLKAIAPTVTGFPVTHQVYIRQAASAITWAIFWSFLMVVVLLFIDFRKVSIVGLSLIPLLLAMIWLQGVMFLLGLFMNLTYNVANIAGLPVLFGLGVVYGCRLVHRWLERPDVTAFAAVRTTGKGVFFAASAAMAGIISIIPARHVGVSDFGIVLFLGLALCLLAALAILPALIDIFFLKPTAHDMPSHVHESVVYQEPSKKAAAESRPGSRKPSAAKKDTKPKAVKKSKKAPAKKKPAAPKKVKK